MGVKRAVVFVSWKDEGRDGRPYWFVDAYIGGFTDWATSQVNLATAKKLAEDRLAELLNRKVRDGERAAIALKEMGR